MLQRLFAGVVPREDRTDLALATPKSPDPWLVQKPASVAALALATELLGALAVRGGTSVVTSTLGPLRHQLRQRFDDGAWAHLQDELLHLLLWMEESLVAARDVSAHDRSRHANEEHYDPAPRRILVEEAMREERDVYLEFLRVDEKDTLRWHRIRVRPNAIEPLPEVSARLDEDEDSSASEVDTLIAKIVPGGDRFTVALRQIRWLMKVRRFSPLQHVPLATVLRFPDPNADDS